MTCLFHFHKLSCTACSPYIFATNIDAFLTLILSFLSHVISRLENEIWLKTRLKTVKNHVFRPENASFERFK